MAGLNTRKRGRRFLGLFLRCPKFLLNAIIYEVSKIDREKDIQRQMRYIKEKEKAVSREMERGGKRRILKRKDGDQEKEEGEGDSNEGKNENMT